MSEDPASHDQLDQLSERVEFIEKTLREQLTRLYAIERMLGLTYRPPDAQLTGAEKTPAPAVEHQADSFRPPLPGRTPQQPPASASSSSRPPVSVTQPTPPAAVTADRTVEIAPTPAMSAASVTPPPSSAHPYEPLHTTTPRLAAKEPDDWRDLESRIGGRWLLWIGIAAITLGIGFFLRLAFENEWIGPWGRLAIVFAIGVGFLLGGERLRARYPIYAYGLAGGGIVALYFVGFAAFSRYQVIAQLPAFLFMAVVTIIAAGLAARYNALPIAILGLIGGFLTPLLLSTGRDNQVGLFSYIALLDFGVLALAYSKRWRVLNYLAFAATIFMFAGWGVEYYAPEKLWTTMFFLTMFFIVFALLAILYNVIHQQATEWFDLAMVLLNGLLYFGTSYSLLEEEHRAYLGLFAVLVAGFYGALGYFTYQRDREDRLLIYMFLGLAFLFTVLAIPIQFDQHWVTMGWAIEGAVMSWIGLKVNDRTSRYAALLVFIVAVTHWALIDVSEFAYRANETFTPLLNRRALSCAVMIVSLALAAWLYKQTKTAIEDQERSMFLGVYGLGANALAVTLLSLDANDYFNQKTYQQRLAAPDDFDTFYNPINNARQFTLSALWSVYGAVALLIGITRKLRVLRYAALLLLMAAATKALAIDLFFYDAEWHTPFLNQTFGACALLIAALAAGAWLYGRANATELEERDTLFPLLVVAANLFAVLAISFEALGHFSRLADAIPLEDLSAAIAPIENLKQFTLSAVWTIYGAVALCVGIRRGPKALRIGSLLLLALAVWKLLLVDLGYYDAQWHSPIFNLTFASFALMILALACAVWFYARAQQVEESERRTLINFMIGLANVLAIIALSAEASGYFEVQMQTAAGESRFGELQLAQQLSLSVVWAMYGGAMLTVGIIRRNRLLRVMALLLIGLTILKVFFFDLSSLERVYRILSFIVLGVILLIVSFLYQRLWRLTMNTEGRANTERPAD